VKENAVIITSDQVIEVDGHIREKPESVDQCKVLDVARERYAGVSCCISGVLERLFSWKTWFETARVFLITRVTSFLRAAVCHVGVIVYNTKTEQRVSGHAVAKQFFKPMPESFFDELIARGDW
jgi:hypothetical protein